VITTEQELTSAKAEAAVRLKAEIELRVAGQLMSLEYAPGSRCSDCDPEPIDIWLRASGRSSSRSEP